MPWFKKGTWTILDQGLFAGSNFVLNIMLARWLTPEAYGAFAIAFTIFLLISTLHTGLLTEPMLVFGPGRYKHQGLAYLRFLIRGHFGLTFFCGVLLAGGGGVLILTGSGAVGRVVLVLGVVQPLILFMWLMRRACYVKLKPAWAASGSAVYACLVLGGVFVLDKTQWLTAETGLGLMGGTSLLAGLWVWLWLRGQRSETVDPDFKATVRQSHWEYGRWASATGALQWVPGQLAFLMLPIWAGLGASGALKALLNLIMPMAHIYGSLSVLLVPVLVRLKETDGFKRGVGWILVAVTLGTSVYWVLLGLGGTPIIDWLYEGQYVGYADLLWLVGSLTVMAGIGSMLRATLRALERPNLVFWAYLASAIIAATVGIGLVAAFGLVGALWSFIVQMVVELGLMGYFFIRIDRVHSTD